jgi:phosphohistidine swiveling domain-containing protein
MPATPTTMQELRTSMKPRPDPAGALADNVNGFAFLGGPVPLSSALYGLKAAWLDRALCAGERVPEAFAVDARSAQQIAAGDPEASRVLARMLDSLCTSLSARAGEPSADASALRLAVRASPTCSLPGALLTQLDVPCELASVRSALGEVVRSGLSPAVREQLGARNEPVPSEPWVGVLVQRYLPTRGRGDFGAVACSREPHSGRRAVCGEYAPGGAADVVSGRMRPEPLEASPGRRALALHDARAFGEIEALAQRLEAHFDEPLELELVRIAGQLWLLQVRALVLAPRALVQLALEAIDADSPRHARWLEQLAGRGLETLQEQYFPELGKHAALLRGLAASPGVASGVLVTDIGRALERARRDPVVLMRTDAVSEDVRAFRVVKAVVTSSGGLTCHAAVIARGLGIPAIVGCAEARVDTVRGQVFAARGAAASAAHGSALSLLAEGDWVSVDGRTGLVYRGALAHQTRIADPELKRLFAQVRKLRPAPLWVFGDAEVALRLKEDACLDGALCTLANGVGPPPARGRECWLELDASEIEERWTSLPAGWGVVLRGDLTRVSIAGLRRAAPLRALGVRLEHPAALLPEGRLDLLVLACSEQEERLEAARTSLLARADAARVLHLLNFSEPWSVASVIASGLTAISVRDNVGWVYSASQAAVGALRDAAQRARARQGAQS